MNNFDIFGPMFDCSRNAVMNVETVKKFIDICSDLGYKSFMLYMEDTYEMLDNPYFGYGRGRYSMEEIKEIDEYAAKKGLAFIPCIQTLGHLYQIFRWEPYKKLRDWDDIMIIGNEEVYALIEKMFETFSKTIRGKVINAGMDEAFMVGRGRYQEANGYRERTEILVEHVARVAEIAQKYGFTISMWSDMFFRLATDDGKYHNPNISISDELKAKIPSNVELIYWNYYETEEKTYTDMLLAHEKLKKGTWFAGALGSTLGFNTSNTFCPTRTEPALKSCIKNGIRKAIMTTWGDDGGECSRLGILPSLFAASEYARGNFDMDSIKEKFLKKYNLPYDDFCLLDLISGKKKTFLCKHIFYNDPFFGVHETLVREDAGKDYALLSEKLAPYTNHTEYGYLFRTAKALCDVLSLKADIGKKIRRAYEENDKKALLECRTALLEIRERTEVYYDCFREQWMTENKRFAFEVTDIRFGGLIKRLEDCARTLDEYLSGDICEIPELAEKLLDANGRGEDFWTCDFLGQPYRHCVSANLLTVPDHYYY